jgi:hypothetical protein
LSALPKAKEMIAGQRELAQRDTSGNGFGKLADRLDEEWRSLCAHVGLDYDRTCLG